MRAWPARLLEVKHERFLNQSHSTCLVLPRAASCLLSPQNLSITSGTVGAAQDTGQTADHSRLKD